MSQKQTDHRNHYVSSLAELPEDESIMPSNTTPIEQLGIELLGEHEVKIPDGEGEGEDDLTPEEMKVQFFSLIADLQRKFPTYTATNFKKYLEDDVGMAEQLQILKDNFRETFKDVSKTDPEYINLLIGMSSIGIEISKDDGEDVLAKSIIKIDLDETVTDV
jgi:hypothetical protein